METKRDDHPATQHSHGRLLYDAAESEKARKAFRSEMQAAVKLIAILGAFSVFMFAVGLLRPAAISYFFFMGILAALFAARVIMKARRYRRRFSFVKIYEKGMVLPWRDDETVRRNAWNFLPFSEIIAVYPNEKSSLTYVVIETRSLGSFDIEKEFIGDLREFLSALGHAVTIEPDKTRTVHPSSTLYLRLSR